jgi:hypothetical protein
MGSVIMPNLGLSAVDQTLFNELSAPRMQAALQNASAGDLVQLSDKALQLQEANGLFGNPGTAPGAPNINSSNALETIDALLLGLTPTSSAAQPLSASATTAASTLAASSEAQLIGTLFGVGTPAGLANPAVNLLA